MTNGDESMKSTKKLQKTQAKFEEYNVLCNSIKENYYGILLRQMVLEKL